MDDPGAPLIRHAQPTDYPRVVAVMDPWWDGRPMSARLSRMFFEHFVRTTFVADVDGRLVGFLLGFLSQSNTDEAYIHFVGVHPDYRRLGLASSLYRHFFSAACAHGRYIVRSSTSPVNERSIEFHRAMGFMFEPGDSVANGVPFLSDYPLPGESRVRFARDLESSAAYDPAEAVERPETLDRVA